MVSRKHFEAFAQWIADEELMGTEESMVERFCKVLKSMNPRFDKERFIARCDELQGFERGDLSFPIPTDKMPLLTLRSLEKAKDCLILTSFGAGGETRKAIDECIHATLKVFPHLKEK